ncbi:MAG: cobalamin-binding protein [Gammaproteobacteria bacterium]|nr:cobalamin-binding protein [Gammaproteobacteria bacterium]
MITHRFSLYVLLLFLFPLYMPVAAAITVKDDTGATVTLSAPARRIVSLAPHNTENLFAAGAGAYVVGVVSYSDHPPEASRIRRVGDGNNLDLEAIVALRPDLVVAWGSGNSKPQIDKLRQLGLKIFASEPRRLDDIPANIEALGQLAGTITVARQSAAAFRAEYARLRDEYAERRPVKVFFQISSRPLMTVNGTHLISNAMKLCGGDNIFADIPTLAPEVSREAVLAADPDTIIVNQTGEKRAPWLDEWRRFPQLQAVKKRGRLYAVRPDLIARPTPRILEGARLICEHLDQVRKTLSSQPAS